MFIMDTNQAATLIYNNFYYLFLYIYFFLEIKILCIIFD